MINNDSDDELPADQEALASNSVGDKVRKLWNKLKNWNKQKITSLCLSVYCSILKVGRNWNEIKIVPLCSSILELGPQLKRQRYTPESV